MKALISGEDNLTIEAEVFPPLQPTADQLIIINSAIGVPKEFYFPIAQHLSQRSFTVVTYDYPTVLGAGQKLNWETDSEKLGEVVFESVLVWCARFYPKYIIHVIGHGAGANIVGFADSCDKIATLITIGAGINSPKTRLENGLFLHQYWNKIIRQVRYRFTGRRRLIPLENLATLEAVRTQQKTLRNSLVEMNESKALLATKFKNFNGRLLTLAPHDDVIPFNEKTEIIRTQCSQATKRIRHLYAEDIEDNYIGFFGVFTPRKNNILWNMIGDWISDNTYFDEPPFGIFDDHEFPLVVITITDIDPTPELLAEYLATMKKTFERGPVFLLIDLTHVHWADSRLPRTFNQWIRENSELVKQNHRYTVYIASNFFIRHFLVIFHSFPFTSIIKPQQVFKSYQAGITWIRNLVAEHKFNNRQS